MHENREISSTPWSDDQGRSAKAINRTAEMHVLEKSDCAVVPVNQPNKGGKPSAEVGEGRARAVENIVRSHMLPTQSGNCMSQGTGGVRQAILPQLIHGKSRMRRRARTDLCGGRSVMVVPTATVIHVIRHAGTARRLVCWLFHAADWRRICRCCVVAFSFRSLSAWISY